jgi:hypothetical protein
MLSTIEPPAPFQGLGSVLEKLLRPAVGFAHPHEVLKDPLLDAAEKRAILSSWASDACAVDSCPALRHPPFASRPVGFDEVMDALASLDRCESGRPLGDRRASRHTRPGDILSL